MTYIIVFLAGMIVGVLLLRWNDYRLMNKYEFPEIKPKQVDVPTLSNTKPMTDEEREKFIRDWIRQQKQ